MTPKTDFVRVDVEMKVQRLVAFFGSPVQVHVRVDTTRHVLGFETSTEGKQDDKGTLLNCCFMVVSSSR